MIILNPLTGYGNESGGDAMIYQEGITHDNIGHGAFIPVQNYLSRHCSITVSLSQCEIGYLKITEISGNSAMEDCWNSDDGSNPGFFIADLEECPDALPSGSMKLDW